MTGLIEAGAFALVLGVTLQLLGCQVEAGDGGGGLDLDGIDGQDVQDAIDQARDVEICPGYTVEELLEADSLSDECREALLSFLPEPQNSAEGRLMAPGGVRQVDGELHLVLQGVDGEGVALDAEALATVEVKVTVDGETRVLADDERSVALAAELPDGLVAVSVVNDYSASMLERDLRDVADVEGELFECLPPVYEAEVVRFSDLVETRLEFTSDATALAEAVAYDEGFDRGTTALLDGLGIATASLAGHPADVRILVVSTDGGENASTMFEQPEVLAALDDAGVFVVVMGALLADVDFMRDLARDRGVYFYTREFSALQAAAEPLLDAFKETVELRIAELDPPPEQVRVAAGELELTLEVSP
ncbi:MAG: vWA domain-containing protein [Myxococcales bacterium]